MIAIFGTPNFIKIVLTTKEFSCVIMFISNCFSESQSILRLNHDEKQLK